MWRLLPPQAEWRSATARRAKRWHIRVSRTAQEPRIAFRAATSDLTQKLGRDPKRSELADYLQVTEAAVAETELASRAFQPEREQQLLLLRFYGNMTQRGIGLELGISQMHVSRLPSYALSYLRENISAGDAPPLAS